MEKINTITSVEKLEAVKEAVKISKKFDKNISVAILRDLVWKCYRCVALK